jgi:GAF domain-containing protein
LLGRAVRLIQERFGLYHVGVYLLDRDGRAAVLEQAAGEKADEIIARRQQVPVGSASTVGLVSSHGVLYAIPDIHEDPVFVPDPLLPDTLSELCFPLKIGDDVIGALDVHHRRRRAFTNDDTAVLETLADQLAVAVQNARLFEEVVRRSRRDEAVIEITSNIRKSGKLDEMLQTAVSEMRKALGARRGLIHLTPSAAERVKDEDGKNGRDGTPPSASARAKPPAEEEESA